LATKVTLPARWRTEDIPLLRRSAGLGAAQLILGAESFAFEELGVSHSHGDFGRLAGRTWFRFSPLWLVFSCAETQHADMRLFPATFIGAVIGGAALLAQTTQDPQQRLTPNEIKWPAAAPATGTAGVAGLQTVVLKGDPKQSGLYTLLLRIPPNTKIQAHSHKDERTAVVVSGLW
jgi:hypothetical protein